MAAKSAFDIDAFLDSESQGFDVDVFLGETPAPAPAGNILTRLNPQKTPYAPGIVPTDVGGSLPLGTAMFESAKAGVTGGTAGLIRGVLETLQSPLRQLEGTPLDFLAAPQREALQPATDLAAGMGETSRAQALEAGQGVTRPTSIDEFLDSPLNAVQYYGNIAAQSAPPMLAAMATRNPRVGADVMGILSGAQTYQQQREEGASPELALGQALTAGTLERGFSQLPLEVAMSGAPLARRLVATSGIEGVTEGVTGAGQSAFGDILAGRSVDEARLLQQALDSAIVGTAMGAPEAILGGGRPAPAALAAVTPAPAATVQPTPQPEPEIEPQAQPQAEAQIQPEAPPNLDAINAFLDAETPEATAVAAEAMVAESAQPVVAEVPELAPTVTETAAVPETTAVTPEAVVDDDPPIPELEIRYGSRGRYKPVESRSSPELVAKATTIADALGPAARHVDVLASTADLPADIASRIEINDRTEGLFDPVSGRAFVFATPNMTPARAAWVAAHEVAGHVGLRGIAMQSAQSRPEASQRMVQTLDMAATNPTVQAISEAIRRESPDYDARRSAEESLAELAAAVRTNNFDGIEQRYGVRVPRAQRAGIRAMIARIVQDVKAFLGKTVGRKVPYSDADVYRLLEDAWQYVKEKPVGVAAVGEVAESRSPDLSKAAREAMKADKKPADWLRGAAQAFFYAQMSEARVLEALYPKVPALKTLFNKVMTAPGQNREVQAILREKAQQTYSIEMNRLDRSLEQNGLSKPTDSQLRQIRAATVGVGVNVPSNIQNVADTIKAINERLRNNLIDVGVPVGEVEGYLQRIYDDNKIMQNPNGFLKAAANHYTKFQFPSEVGQPRNMPYEPDRFITFLTHAQRSQNPKVKATLTGIKDKAKLYSQTSDLQLIRDIESLIAGIYGDVANDYGKRNADAWLFAIRSPTIQQNGEGIKNPATTATKERTLTKEADVTMADWMRQNPLEVMATHVEQMAKRTAQAQLFGPENQDFQALVDSMVRDGMKRHDAQRAVNIVQRLMGAEGPGLDENLGAFADFSLAVGTISLLDNAVLNSVMEPVAAAVRTRDVRNAFGTFVQAARALRRLAKSPTQRDKLAEELSELIGTVHRAGADAMQMERLMGGYQMKGLPRMTVAAFFQATGLGPLTQSQRKFQTLVGNDYVKRLARGAMKGDRESLANLAELGISADNAKPFAQWMLALGRAPTAAELFDDGGNLTPMGSLYTTAVTRYINQVIQAPSAEFRPGWQTTAWGRIFSSIMGFSYTFYQNIIKREIEVAKRQPTAGGKALSVGATLASFAALYAAQTMISTLRELVQNGDKWKDMDEEERLRKLMALGMTRTFGLGSFDPLINYISGVEYRKSLIETVAGATPGYLAENVDKVTTPARKWVMGEDISGTDKYRMGEGTFNLMVQPTIHVLLAAAPGTTLAQKSEWVERALQGTAFAGILNTDRLRKPFAEMVGQPPERRNNLDKAYTEATKRYKELDAELSGRVARLPPEQWEAEFERMKAEYPDLLRGTTLATYKRSGTTANGRRYEKGEPKPLKDGKLQLDRMGGDIYSMLEGEAKYAYDVETGRARRYTTQGLNDEIRAMSSRIEDLRADLPVSLLEFQTVASGTEALRSLNLGEQQDLSKPVGRWARNEAIKELEQKRSQLKKEAVQAMGQ